MLNYVGLRIKQIVRVWKDIGFFYIFMLFGIIAVIFLIINHYIQEINVDFLEYYVLLCHFIILLVIRFKRNDFQFLLIVFKNIYLIQILDYFIISLPLFLLYILNGWIHVLLISFSIIIIVPIAKNKNKLLNKKIIRISALGIAKSNYEWIAGIRKYSLILMIFLTLTLLASWYSHYSVLIFSFCIMLTGAFYKKFEPHIFIESQNLSAKKFLKRKIKDHILASGILFLTLIPYVFFNIEYFYIVLVLFFLSSVAITWLNISKYYYYQPNSYSFKNELIGGMVAVCIFPFSFLLPLAILFILFYFKPSINNLKCYFDD